MRRSGRAIAPKGHVPFRAFAIKVGRRQASPRTVNSGRELLVSRSYVLAEAKGRLTGSETMFLWASPLASRPGRRNSTGWRCGTPPTGEFGRRTGWSQPLVHGQAAKKTGSPPMRPRRRRRATLRGRDTAICVGDSQPSRSQHHRRTGPPRVPGWRPGNLGTNRSNNGAANGTDGSPAATRRRAATHENAWRAPGHDTTKPRSSVRRAARRRLYRCSHHALRHPSHSQRVRH